MDTSISLTSTNVGEGLELDSPVNVNNNYVNGMGRRDGFNPHDNEGQDLELDAGINANPNDGNGMTQDLASLMTT